jgi:hypothetical protein
LNFILTHITLYETNITTKEELMLDKKNYQLAGILWIVAVLTVFISLIISLQYDITLNPEDIEKALVNVHVSSVAHIVELVLDELTFFALIAVAAPLYIIFRRYDTTLALMGTLLLSAGGIVGVVHDMGYFAITQLADAYAVSSGTEAVVIKAATLATVLTAKWGINISSFLIALGSIIFNYIIVFQGAGVKWLGWFGLLANALVFVAIPIALNPAFEQLSYALYLPFTVWGVAFGIWLLRRKS